MPTTTLPMTTPTNEKPIKYTHIDLELAKAYYPILADVVGLYRGLSTERRASWQMSYSDLVAQAKEKYPDNPAVQSATSINTGRRLGVIRQLANGDCPDMSCLIFNKTSNEVGSAYQNEFNPAVERAKLLEEFYRNTFDFHNFKDEFFSRIDTALSQLGDEVDRSRKSTSPVSHKKKINEDEAANLCFQYYRQHRASLPAAIATEKASIIDDIIEGVTVDAAFQNAIARLNAQPIHATQQPKKADK